MKINNEKQKKAIYSATALVLCAAALGSFWMTKKSTPKAENESKTEITSESVTQKPTQVNSPVTNIPDERVTVTTESETVYFAKPTDNKIIKHFSGDEMVKNKTTDDWRTHGGIDIAGKTGDPVKVICDGLVTEVRDDILWGTVVSVDHGNGIISEYRGLGRGSTPEVGTKIKVNDKIGNLGEIPIEKEDGVHLHLEIYEKGTLTDPEKIIGQNYKFSK